MNTNALKEFRVTNQVIKGRDLIRMLYTVPLKFVKQKLYNKVVSG